MIRLCFLLLFTSFCSLATPPGREFFEVRTYHITSADQEKQVDDYLKSAYLPALHRAGIRKVGVFKPVEKDTANFGKRIIVLIPYTSLEQFAGLGDVLSKDKQYQADGKSYIDLPHTAPPFVRIESVVLKAFKDQPKMEVPAFNSPAGDRIYELRSYEGYTEKIYKNKEHMFNEGGEIALFKRLGFNAVFYGEVLAGSRMPNLMYMTSFTNQASRDEHWKTFVDDAEWKKLSSMPEYQKNVSKITIYLLHPTTYSDI